METHPIWCKTVIVLRPMLKPRSNFWPLYTILYYTVFQKKPFLLFFHNSLKWWSIYRNFVSCSWKNINLEYFNKIWQLIKYSLWHNADVTVCREYKLACLNWCYQLLPCFDSKLNLVCWWRMFILSALSNMGAVSYTHLTLPTNREV